MNRAFIGGFRPRGEKKAPAKRRIVCAPPQKKAPQAKNPKDAQKNDACEDKNAFSRLSCVAECLI